MKTEIERIAERTETAVLYAGGKGAVEELEMGISDLIANLAILAHERELPVADLIVRGLAHYAAAYMEPMEADEAEQWLNEALFPFTGEHQFAEYVAEQAITLSGKTGRVTVPEWGT